MLKLLGLLLALSAFPMLFLNEGRAVRTARSLEEGAAVVLHVKASLVEPANEGKLVHFSGMAATGSPLRDPIFGVEAKALQLSRKVEMYQWKEINKSSGRGNSNDPNVYDYETVWSEQALSSGQFKRPQNHENPPMPYRAETLVAGDVTVGDYQVSRRFIASLGGAYVPLTLDEASLAAASAVSPAGKPKLDGGGLYFGANPAEPHVGDARVRFAALGLGEISVIGRQRGNAVEPYPTRAGGTVELAQVGVFDADEMFDGAVKRNTFVTWAARIGGFLLMFAGAALIFKPLGLVRFIPAVGGVVNAGAGLLAFVLASAGSLATIALAWIVYRPLLGLELLVVAGAAGAFAWSAARRTAVPDARGSQS